MTQPRLLGGRYELDGIVGRGGMAEVFRARDIRLDRIVAVKTLRDDLARDQTFQARFRREAQSAASLNHPSIVAVYDTGEDMVGSTPVPYIVMEYVDGRTLRDLLRDDRRLLPERALEITDGVLRALDYSHRNGIVHRDIKPGNVMLTRTGDVKVMDFGIARAVSDAQATMTQTAQVIGTAQYLSPEQARGERVDARSDLYSTGCLLYELLTGRPPFTGDSPGGDRLPARAGAAGTAVPGGPGDPGLGGRDRAQGDGQGPGRPLSVRRRDAQRHPARAVGRARGRADPRRGLSRAPGGWAHRPRWPARPAPSPLMTTARRTSSRPAAAAGGGRGWWRSWSPLLLVAGLIFAFKYISGSGGDIAVPPVNGLTLKAAETDIANAHLISVVKTQSSSSTPKGHVISTSPPNGKLVPKNSSVTLLVSTGPGKVTVPDRARQAGGRAQRIP